MACKWCGLFHGAQCPSVKAFEYHQDGTIKRVEFYSPVDYRPITTPTDWTGLPFEPHNRPIVTCGAIAWADA